MCANDLERKLKVAQSKGTLPKVVIPVHLCNNRVTCRRLLGFRESMGFKVIEDASHAIGGKYYDKPIGNCEYSDITVFSFHPVKIIAEGKMTNDSKLAPEWELLRKSWSDKRPSLMDCESHGSWYYQQIDLGLNCRMTELQALLGLSDRTS